MVKFFGPPSELFHPSPDQELSEPVFQIHVLFGGWGVIYIRATSNKFYRY